MPPSPRVLIISPAAAEANNGNWHTAWRWSQMLRPAFDVSIAQTWNGEPFDVMLALHARRSAASIAAWRDQAVARPLVVALTGPRMSSAGYLVARDLKAAGAATLIGGETGGNLRGLNGSQLAWLVLPTSGVSVDIPLLAHFTAGEPPDRGVLPDIAVRTRLEDVAAGIDPDRIAAERWFAERAYGTRWRADGR